MQLQQRFLRTYRVVWLLGVLLFGCSAAHLLEEFGNGFPARLGLSVGMAAALAGGLYAIQAAGLVLAARVRPVGFALLTLAGLLWAVAVLADHHADIFSFAPYREGWLTRGLEIGTIALGVALSATAFNATVFATMWMRAMRAGGPPAMERIRPGAAANGEASLADTFQKFTERARKMLSLAQEEALRFNHNYIGTEHLLLGLVRENEGVAARVLHNLGVDLEKVRQAVEFIIGRGDRIVLGEIGLTPRAKKVIELAMDEARRLNHHYIGTEHILLGLVREGEGIAAGVLESLGVHLEKVRSQTIRVLQQARDEPPPAPPPPDEPPAPQS